MAPAVETLVGPRQGKPSGLDSRTLAGVRTRRSVIDYALQRRALLADLYAGRISAIEVCDATPYLQRAAKYHGQRTDVTCPVCRREPTWSVNYVYGDELKTSSGQARATAELLRMVMSYGAFRVYVVEVCRGCGWNHLIESYVLGRDALPADRQTSVGEPAARQHSRQ
jgi:hypothetical protein